MADVSKANKLASARKKLKQFQQRNKDPCSNVIRSASSSLKSNSPVDNVFNVEEQRHLVINTLDVPSPNIQNVNTEQDRTFEDIYRQHDINKLFDYQTNKSDNFFDNVSHNLRDNLQVASDSDKLESIEVNGDYNVNKTCEDTGQITLYHFAQNGNSHENKLPINHVADLEKTLSLEKSYNSELQTKLMDSHNHILSLQHEIKRLNENQSQIISDEVSELENKITVNLQTIEILVSEKSELQKELMLLQDNNSANNSKCEELASRLKASRCQVQKLEKALLDSSEIKTQHGSVLAQLNNDLNQKDFIVHELLQKLSEAQNEIKELNKKIELESINRINSSKEFEEMEKQLSMAQIKLTQLGSENGTEVFKELEKVKIELETTKKEAERAWEESKRCETELKQYISNLNSQVLQANAKCERAEREKNDSTLRVDNLVQHISDLEKQLQHERNLRESAVETETIKNLKGLLQEQKKSLINKDIELKKVIEELIEVKEKLNEVEIWKENVPDMGLLQQAMESDRVAAARAIEQNNALKQKLQELEEYIIKINNNKLELTDELDKYRHMAGEYRLNLEKYKSMQEMRMVDSVTQTNFVKKLDSVSQTTYQDLAIDSDPHEPVSVETMVMIEGKLKKTMNKIAELSDDKQRLEHLVLQLQSETETIGEYVTLYQHQRSLLKEKADEKEREIKLIAKEREYLKSKLNEINILLTRFPHNPEVENTTCQISSLLGEIQSSNIVQEKPGSPSTFHPCLLCSGKLINV